MNSVWLYVKASTKNQRLLIAGVLIGLLLTYSNIVKVFHQIEHHKLNGLDITTGMILHGLGSSFLMIFLGVAFLFVADSVIQQKTKIEYDNAFSNALYTCQNEACTTRYFRMHQLMKKYQSGELTVPGETGFTEMTYAHNFTPEQFEDLGFVMCPTCSETPERMTKEFSWMKTNPEFPALTEKQLLRRLHSEPSRKSKQALGKKLDRWEQDIELLEEIESFQSFHKLGTPHDAFVEKHINELSRELIELKNQTHNAAIQKRIYELIARLSPETPSTNKELEKTLDEIKEQSRVKRRGENEIMVDLLLGKAISSYKKQTIK